MEVELGPKLGLELVSLIFLKSTEMKLKSLQRELDRLFVADNLWNLGKSRLVIARFSIMDIFNLIFPISAGN